MRLTSNKTLVALSFALLLLFAVIPISLDSYIDLGKNERPSASEGKSQDEGSETCGFEMTIQR